MKTRIRPILAALVLFCSPGLGHAADPVTIQLDRSSERFGLGLAPLNLESGDAALARFHSDTLRQDLSFSNYFNLVSDGPAVKAPTDAARWAKLGPSVVAVPAFTGGATASIRVTLFDTGSGKQVLSASRSVAPNAGAIRAGTHEIANEIVKYITGRPGIFTSKIVFINDATGRKELYVADYDGRNARRLTNDNSIVILPRISPDGERIVFTSYLRGNPDLYIIKADGSGRRRLSGKAGLNVSPSWAPNNSELAVTLSIDGPPNVYLIKADTGEVARRLTDTAGADTAPSFSPDGTRLSITSDRGGAPHIYIMSLDGTETRRITTASHCDSSAWSPDGQVIAYVKGDRKFDV